eukprot:1140511-Pelagomonas_calceolata.AAC.1
MQMDGSRLWCPAWRFRTVKLLPGAGTGLSECAQDVSCMYTTVFVRSNSPTSRRCMTGLVEHQQCGGWCACTFHAYVRNNYVEDDDCMFRSVL